MTARRSPNQRGVVAAASPRHPASAGDALLLCVLSYVLVSVWRIQDLYPMLGTIRAPWIITLSTLVLFALDTNPMRRLVTIGQPVLYLSLAMAGAVVASGLFGVWAGNTFGFLANDFAKTLGLMVVLAASIRGADDLRRLAITQVLGGALYCITIMSRFTVGPDGRLESSVFYDANDLAMMLVVTLPFVLLLIRFATNRLTSIVALLTLPVYLLTIMKTGSRGGFLAMLAVATYLLFGFKSFSRRVRFTVVVLGALGFAAIASGRYWAMMGTMLNPTADYNFVGNSRSGRMELWKRGMGYLWQYPLFGVGAANFQFAEGNLSDVAPLRRYGIYYKTMVPHNSYVQVAAETGLLGIGIFVSLLVVAVRTANRWGSSAPANSPTFEAAVGQSVVAALIGYSVAAFFLTQGFAAILYVLFAVILAMGKPNVFTSPQEAVAGSVRVAVGDR